MILIVEDEPEIAELIRFHLQRERLESRVVSSGRAALGTVASLNPELILLDLMLPDLDGLEVCRRLKRGEATRHIPILIVTAKGEESDIVAGLELGADDYVIKPFSPKVLVARVKRILRRPEEADQVSIAPTSEHVINFDEGGLTIDPDRHVVLVEGQPIELTVTEFEILRYLAAKPGFVRTRDQIIAAVHGQDVVLSSRTVDVHITALRKKLAARGAMVQTVRGVGYRLNDAGVQAEA